MVPDWSECPLCTMISAPVRHRALITAGFYWRNFNSSMTDLKIADQAALQKVEPESRAARALHLPAMASSTSSHNFHPEDDSSSSLSGGGLVTSTVLISLICVQLQPSDAERSIERTSCSLRTACLIPRLAKQISHRSRNCSAANQARMRSSLVRANTLRALPACVPASG